MRQSRPRIFIALTVLSVASLICLAFSWPRGLKYEFLDGQRPLFSVDLGVGGFISEAYTWKGNYNEVVRRADLELKAKGMFRQNYKKVKGVYFYRPMGDPLGSVTIDLQPERTVGKHFAIDGDFLDSSREPGWISVQVLREDPLPIWLRSFLNGL